jgi:hypothetical protein
LREEEKGLLNGNFGINKRNKKGRKKYGSFTRQPKR